MIVAKNSAERTRKRNNLTRDDWTDAALDVLISSGVTAVKVEALASRLKATRGSFYWHFSEHADLLETLLARWMAQNVEPFLSVPTFEGEGPAAQLARFSLIWLSDLFDPRLDAAVRDWARISEDVDRKVIDVDARRVDILVGLLQRSGYEHEEALVRARILYYHQIGYYSMREVQSRAERLAYFPTYFRLLTGFPLPPETQLPLA